MAIALTADIQSGPLGVASGTRTDVWSRNAISDAEHLDQNRLPLVSPRMEAWPWTRRVLGEVTMLEVLAGRVIHEGAYLPTPAARAGIFEIMTNQVLSSRNLGERHA
jgi:hypothetical protein